MIQQIEVDAALTIDFGAARLAHGIRRAADRSLDPLDPGKTADAWLLANIGRVDDPIRRAAVAALALGLKPDARSLPGDMLALYPATHMRLLRFLEGRHPYNADLFAKDIALATGAAVPTGAVTAALPGVGAPCFSTARLLRAAAGCRRQWGQDGPREALAWLRLWGPAPWAELHVDTRNLQAFNAQGMILSYHRLAALMELRSDLAGIYGASWLYQPELADISPGLAFVREGAEAGGGRLVRLRADPVQTAYAIARSPHRRRLLMSGQYRPICYGMFWERQKLMDWSRSELARRSPGYSPPTPSDSVGDRRR